MDKLQKLLNAISDFPDWVSGCSQLLDNLCDTFNVRAGVHRIVFSCTDWDYVIKINKEDEVDDCAKEVQRYSKGTELFEDLSFLLAPISYLGTHGKHKVYKQSKVCLQEDLPTGLYNQVYNRTVEDGLYETFCEDNTFLALTHDFEVDDMWLSWFCAEYGLESLYDFYDLVETLNLNDLHAGNVGYINGLTPCICDYAGYGF